MMKTQFVHEHDTAPTPRQVKLGSALGVMIAGGLVWLAASHSKGHVEQKPAGTITHVTTPQDRVPKGKHLKTEIITFAPNPSEGYHTVWDAAVHIRQEEGKPQDADLTPIENQIEDAAILAGYAKTRSEAVNVQDGEQVSITFAVPDQPKK